MNEQSTQMDSGGATIVLVTYNSASTIENCLESLSRTISSRDEVIVAGNASKDRTRQFVRGFLCKKNNYRLIVNHSNRGYAAAANQGAWAGRKPYIVFLNPDTKMTGQWVAQLVFHLEPKVKSALPLLPNC